MEIKLLTEETISRISAGEVIERPLNVVKELVENSIDAGATAITVEIRDGGISMIRVTDNGCGIEQDQIGRAFVRHATSKIRDAADLSHLSSLGFRGEALASIAAVAQVEMITKVRESLLGTRAVNDHLAAYSPDTPVRIDLEEIGAPDGTTVIVRNLFGSIPVRRRFLRQPQTEAGYITDLIEKQALSHPLVSFHYRVNGQDRLHTTGNGNLRELIYRIYGRETANAIVPIHAEDPDHGMVLEGFLGKPEISRTTRSFETFFINGRMLKSRELSAGLEEGYRTDLMQHRFPFAVLHLTMPPEDLDVNVHPSKMEVRFTDRRAVLHFLDSSVHETLSKIELIPKATLRTAKQERALRQKEARLKEEQLRKAPAYEAFESARTDRIPAPPAKSVGTAAAPAGSDSPAENSSTIFELSSRNIPASSPDRSVAPSKDQPFSDGVSRKDALYQTEREAKDPLLFEDRRPYTVTHAQAYTSAAAAADSPGSEPADFSASDQAGPGYEASASTTAGTLTPDAGPAVPEAAFPDGIPEQLSFTDALSENTSPEKDFLLTGENAARFRLIGQVFDTYWLIEYEKQLLIIDQHAAHEKVNYERMMNRIAREHPALDHRGSIRTAAPEEYLALDRLLEKERTAKQRRDEAGEQEPVFVASQQLLPPIVLRLSGQEENAYRQFQDVFAAMGYEIEDFGGSTFAIRAVPAELFGQTADSLFREVLEEIISERVSGTPGVILSKIASLSCKAAVKGNSRLSETEAKALIAELITLENPYHCPHGRPTMIVMSQREMDRKFKRII